MVFRLDGCTYRQGYILYKYYGCGSGDGRSGKIKNIDSGKKGERKRKNLHKNGLKCPKIASF